MTTSQRMERQFFINLIRLVNEVQNPSKEFHSYRRSEWCKSVKSPRQKSDALTRV
jgi:hypothetical protein